MAFSVLFEIGVIFFPNAFSLELAFLTFLIAGTDLKHIGKLVAFSLEWPFRFSPIIA